MADHTSHLTFGARADMPDIAAWDTFPFEGEMQVKPLDPLVRPEPARGGVGGADCYACDRADDTRLWTDDHWGLSTMRNPSGLPATLFLEPHAHHDLADVPAEAMATFGSTIQRVEKAYMSLGGIARVHFARYGDGAEHFHLWVFGRPEGMLQLRGSFLPVWDDTLPPIPRDRWESNLRHIARAMAEGGGTAHR